MTQREKGSPSAGGSALTLCLLALVVLNLWSCSSLAAELRHNLSNRPAWVPTKTRLERDVIGSVSFAKTPLAVAGDSLNLGAWHGFQEVLFAEPIELERMRWRMQMPEGAWASVVFDHDEGGFSGFLLSRNPQVESAAFRSDAEGRFLERRALQGVELSDDWHAFELSADAVEYVLRIDAQEAARFPQRGQAARVGFRGGMEATYVDDVSIAASGGAPAFQDSFDARLPGALGIGVLLLLIAGTTAGVGWLAARSRPRELRLRYALFASLAFNLFLLFAGGTALFVEEKLLSDRYGYSTLHFKLRKKLERPPRPLSSWRVVLPALRERYEGQPAATTQRIFLIGSSQTWGSGASRFERDIGGRLERKLQERLAPGSVEVVNLAVSGKDSTFLYENFESEWSHWDPALVVINLGNNDWNGEILRAKLVAFAKHNRERGVETLFVLEANHPQRRDSLAENHQVMREVAENEGIAVVDLHSLLAARNGEGFLWWDFVHLSDYGQALTAEILADAVTEALARADEEGPS